jgi:hypothetical protein
MRPDFSRLGLVTEGTDRSWAVFNSDHTRRYLLGRTWGELDGMHATFAMCNPSQAGADNDDATIRKCIGFGKRLRQDGILAVNASSLISTDPRALMKAADLCDSANLSVIRGVFSSMIGLRIAAWGALSPALRKRMSPGIVALKSMGHPLVCFGRTKDGSPHHPSRIPYDSPLVYLADGRAY